MRTHLPCSVLLLVTLALADSRSLAARPVAQQPAGGVQAEYGCVICHAEKRRAFRLGVHSERGIRCHDCHGGDTTAYEMPSAHSDGFIGSPDKLQTIRVCSRCHSDPDRMRQYGLPAGQLAEFRTSRHGELLLDRRNFDAPTCTNCHDAHTILPPNDARSNVYPTNIPETCGRCHRDGGLMGKYGLPTDQLEQLRNSAHGKALFDRNNFAAPTCISCHGSHAALPPRVSEIANVCGQCHVLVRRAFYAGPHGQAAQAGRLPGCTACHSNHGTEGVQPEQIAATCRDCHERSGRAGVLGLEIQEQVTRAGAELESAAAAIDELVRAGHQVADIRFRYYSALTAFEQMAQAQHSLDRERLEELGRQVSSISRDIRGTAEVAREHRWEHQLYLIPIWFIALAAVVLAYFKLRALREAEG